jgi:energy-coupling factor transporter ATP-binding protein EcfA2
MQLDVLRFIEFENQPREWRMEDVSFGSVTLLVGKNASGKSRTLNVIAGLAKLLRGESKPLFESGDYIARFKDAGALLEYRLKIQNGNVILEEFKRDSDLLLKRGPNGVGQIRALKLNQTLEFQTPTTELAAVSRRDNLQHPFFEALNVWANGVRHFQFGTPLGQASLVLQGSDKKTPHDPKDTNAVLKSFQEGEATYGPPFKQGVIDDMGRVGYDLSDVGLRVPQKIQFQGPSLGTAYCLFVKEKRLKSETEQFEMSQGMFRALSVIIQFNYARFSNTPSCILIDDIGEGLDFDRSISLVELLITQATKSGVQLIMSTNDRFVMNKVPLEYWSIIQRVGSHCRYFNYSNSKAQFEEFKFTGMNNFDFFATDFLGGKTSKNEETGDLR